MKNQLTKLSVPQTPVEEGNKSPAQRNLTTFYIPVQKKEKLQSSDLKLKLELAAAFFICHLSALLKQSPFET
jgi:hypothetical protein